MDQSTTTDTMQQGVAPVTTDTTMGGTPNPAPMPGAAPVVPEPTMAPDMGGTPNPAPVTPVEPTVPATEMPKPEDQNNSGMNQ